MRVFDAQTLNYVRILEDITGAKVKDCFVDENGIVVFVIYPGDIGKAIGKSGNNIKMVMKILNKKISIIEFNEDPKIFIKNCIKPINAEVTINDKEIIIKSRNIKEKGLLIGREKSRLKKLKTLAQKYYGLGLKIV